MYLKVLLTTADARTLGFHNQCVRMYLHCVHVVSPANAVKVGRSSFYAILQGPRRQLVPVNKQGHPRTFARQPARSLGLGVLSFVCCLLPAMASFPQDRGQDLV